MQKLKLAYCPTRRDVFSRTHAMQMNERIRHILDDFDIEVVDLSGINEEALLYQDCDIAPAIDRFLSARVDALLIPHCNFGSENRVAQVARALGVPTLLWGPRDDAPDVSGLRSRDSQCGMFATGKVLRRHNVPFTYLTGSWIDSGEFQVGFAKFLRVANAVRALKNLNILQISTRPEPFCSVICNENELLERFNVHLYPVTLHDLIAEQKRILAEGGEELDATVAKINEIGTAGTPEQVARVAALKVAMRSLAEKYRCRAVAIQCWTALQDMADIMACCANALLTDEGIPVVCETDIHGAITAVLMQAVGMEESTPFFADVTVRHPQNDNAELLWHCGNFPYSLAKDKTQASVGCSCYHNDTYGICAFELREGPLTVARFDGDHGEYRLFIGEAHTTQGPKNVGSYVWIEVQDWPKWEHKLVTGPYIHHVSCLYGHYAEILYEVCKYLPALQADPVDGEQALAARWR